LTPGAVVGGRPVGEPYRTIRRGQFAVALIGGVASARGMKSRMYALILAVGFQREVAGVGL